MAIPEGLNTMPEELELPEQTSGLAEPRTSPVAQSPSIKARMRKYLAPAAAALGIATGVLYSADTTPIAAAPVGETATPNGPSAFDAVDTIFLPRVDTGSTIHATSGTPVGPGETATPTATNSPEPSATNTPVIPITETPTPTSSATPTETATPTEQGPLHELPLPLGARVAIPAGPSLGDANSFKNGDRDSGAAVAGLSFDNLKDPFRDGNYVVGELSYPGDDPDTTHVTEQRHTQTVLVPVDQVDSEKLERVRAFNPETDKKPGYEIPLWNGKDGKEFTFLGTAANDGTGLLGGRFFTDFSRQSAEINLKAYATGQRGKSTYIILGSFGDTPNAFNNTIIEVVAGSGQVNIRNSQTKLALVAQSSGPDAEVAEYDPQSNEQNSPLGLDPGKLIYQFPSGMTDVKFTLTEGSIIVDGQDYPIEHGPRGQIIGIGLQGDGDRRASTTLHIKQMGIKFANLDGAALRETPETTLPSLANLADQAGLTILVPAEGLGGQPDSLQLYAQTGQLLNLNHVAGIYGTDVEAFMKDQGKPYAELLSASDTDADLLEQVKAAKPGSVFQMSPTGTQNGIVAPWFDNKGKLTRSPQTLLKLATAAKETGNTLIINTGVSLDLDYANTQSSNPSPMDNVLQTMRDLAVNQQEAPIIVTFNGDQNAYVQSGSQSDLADSMTTTLKYVKDQGIRTGLTDIIGNDTEWFGTTTRALLESGSNIAGYGFISDQRPGDSQIGVFKYQYDKNEPNPHDRYRLWQYTDGAKIMKQTMIDYLSRKQQGSSTQSH